MKRSFATWGVGEEALLKGSSSARRGVLEAGQQAAWCQLTIESVRNECITASKGCRNAVAKRRQMKYRGTLIDGRRGVVELLLEFNARKGRSR